MTYQEKIYRRECVLNEFEIAVSVYFNSSLSNEDIVKLVKRKHEEITAKLQLIHSDYINAPKPEDPFKD